MCPTPLNAASGPRIFIYLYFDFNLSRLGDHLEISLIVALHCMAWKGKVEIVTCRNMLIIDENTKVELRSVKLFLPQIETFIY